MATVDTGLVDNPFGLKYKGIIEPGPIQDEFDNITNWTQDAAQAIIDIGNSVAGSSITIPPFVLKYRENLPPGPIQDEFDNIASYLSQIYDAIQVLKGP